MARSKNDVKADASEVATVRLDVETMGEKFEGLQSKVTAVKSQLSRMEEMMLRMETLLSKTPDFDNTNSGTTKQPKGSVTTLVHNATQQGEKLASSNGGQGQLEPVLDRGTPIWRRTGRREQTTQEYHDFRSPQEDNAQQYF